VSVAESDPARALFAAYAGYKVGAIDDLVAQADVIVTATGRTGILNARHFPHLKPGASS
jgi:adenosylhomocysteinase